MYVQMIDKMRSLTAVDVSNPRPVLILLCDATRVYDAVLQSILEDEDEFLSQAKYTYLDASCTLEGNVRFFERGELEENEVMDWASRKAQPGDQSLSHLKILCFEPANSEDPDEVPVHAVPCSYDVYESIKAAWRLPEWILRFLDPKYGNGLILPYGALTMSKNVKRFGVAMKDPSSHLIVAFYEVDLKTMYVLVCVNSEIETTLDELLDRVEKSQEAVYCPILVPLLVAEIVSAEVNGRQTDQQERIESIERKQELYAFDDEGSDSEEDEEENLLDFMREFTKLHALSRTSEDCANAMLEFAELITAMHHKFYDGLDTTQQQQVAPMWQRLYERLFLLETQVRLNRKYILNNQAEIQMAIQTINAIISTNDSRLNYESAQASLRIAQDSRKVAVLTRQDSTDMRVIAGTTLLFLPATFVATLFSTDFFNFQPASGFVSSWIWLYCAVTSVLTIAVMFAWRLLSKAREKETAQILRKKDEDVDEHQDEDEKSAFRPSVASGNALQNSKNSLFRRKKTPTMEMEANEA